MSSFIVPFFLIRSLVCSKFSIIKFPIKLFISDIFCKVYSSILLLLFKKLLIIGLISLRMVLFIFGSIPFFIIAYIISQHWSKYLYFFIKSPRITFKTSMKYSKGIQSINWLTIFILFLITLSFLIYSSFSKIDLTTIRIFCITLILK